MNMLKGYGKVMLALVFAFSFVLAGIGETQTAEANCGGVNDVVETNDGSTKQKYVYMDSCVADSFAAEVDRDASNNALIATMTAAVPGLQQIALGHHIASHIDSNRSNDVTQANSHNDGVVVLFEQDLSHRDTYHMWLYQDTSSQ